MAEISQNYIFAGRSALRITHSKHDCEISDLIAAARDDLRTLGGIKAEKVNDESDPLIKRAVMTYLKANFGLDNPDSQKYEASYEAMKKHLMLSSDYKESESE